MAPATGARPFSSSPKRRVAEPSSLTSTTKARSKRPLASRSGTGDQVWPAERRVTAGTASAGAKPPRSAAGAAANPEGPPGKGTAWVSGLRASTGRNGRSAGSVAAPRSSPVTVAP